MRSRLSIAVCVLSSLAIARLLPRVGIEVQFLA